MFRDSRYSLDEIFEFWLGGVRLGKVCVGYVASGSSGGFTGRGRRGGSKDIHKVFEALYFTGKSGGGDANADRYGYIVLQSPRWGLCFVRAVRDSALRLSDLRLPFSVSRATGKLL
jgi:hypothetical protein